MPILPEGDPGTFSLTAGTQTNPSAGNGQSAPDTAVPVGSSTGVSEVTNPNYDAGTISCTPSVTNPATFTMPDANVSCTIVNTRKTRTLTLTKTEVRRGGTGGCSRR